MWGQHQGRPTRVQTSKSRKRISLVVGGIIETKPTPKSKPQNSKIQNPKSKLQDPKSKLQDPKSKLQDPKSKLQDPKSIHLEVTKKVCKVWLKNLFVSQKSGTLQDMGIGNFKGDHHVHHVQENTQGLES